MLISFLLIFCVEGYIIYFLNKTYFTILLITFSYLLFIIDSLNVDEALARTLGNHIFRSMSVVANWCKSI